MFLLTTLPPGYPFFLEILALCLDAITFWVLQALTPHHLPCAQPWGPSPLHLRHSRKSLRRCSFPQWGERGLLNTPSSSLALRLSIGHPASKAPFPVSGCPAAGRSADVPCALCSWNRIWTRYSSIWKKWGSLTCLASAKQREHGNASCATTLKKQPVRDTPLLLQIMCAPGDWQGPVSPPVLVDPLLAYTSSAVITRRGVPDGHCLVLRKASHQSGSEEKSCWKGETHKPEMSERNNTLYV